MEKGDERYKSLALPKQSYMVTFIVECPKCNEAAKVDGVSPWSPNKRGVLSCTSCSYTATEKDRIIYNVKVKRNCDNCGKVIQINIPNQKTKKEELTVPCPHCSIVRNYKVRNEETIQLYPDSGKASDPVFNLPLWFQTEVKGNQFWAYNRQHLSAIKEYVQAKLRERQTFSYTTMVEKLPQFISSAKNRTAILKGISQLENKHQL